MVPFYAAIYVGARHCLSDNMYVCLTAAVMCTHVDTLLHEDGLLL